jgi:hypothetical protein
MGHALWVNGELLVADDDDTIILPNLTTLRMTHLIYINC